MAREARAAVAAERFAIEESLSVLSIADTASLTG
jgi:hypothetical protein